MRLTNRCFLSLALCFTLSFLLQPKTARGGDAILPPGCCQFFCEADFAPLDIELHSRTYGKSSSGSAARKTVTPVQTMFAPPSTRIWHFHYKAASKVRTAPSTVSRRPSGYGYSYCNPHQREPVMRLKAQVAPMLFLESGSWSDMTILMRLFVGEVATTLRTCTAPMEQLPSRAVRLVGDVIMFQ